MDSSSKRAWIGGVVLSGTLLLSSLPCVYALGNTIGPGAGSVSIPLKNFSVFSAQSVRYEIVSTAAQSQSVLGTHSSQNISFATGDREGQQTTTEVSAENVTANEERAETVTVMSSSEQAPRQVAVAASSEISRGGRPKVEEILHNAQSLIGIPYVFGGTTSKGFDCSGFTQYVYKGSGIDLPRTSYAQYGLGEAIKKDQLQPGDLVFFSTYDQGASHVGIYMGGGSFIHASREGIKITSLSDSYYSSRYLGARRVL